MIHKKHPEVDLSSQRGLIFQICLFCILLIANIAFEWRSYDDFEQIDLSNDDEYEIILSQENLAKKLPKPLSTDSSEITETSIYEQEAPLFSISLDYEE